MSEIAKAIDRVRQFFKKRPNISKASVAARVSLHRNTLYGIDDNWWNPRAETLRLLDQAMKEIEAEEGKPKRRPLRRARAEAA